MGSDSLRLELEAPSRIALSTPVRFTLRVRNQTDRSVDLYLRGRTATFDVVVARPDGDVIWRRLEGEIIPAIVHLRVLKPREVLELAAVWDQRTRDGHLIAPGRYSARALLLVEGEPLEAPAVPLEVLGR